MDPWQSSTTTGAESSDDQTIQPHHQWMLSGGSLAIFACGLTLILAGLQVFAVILGWHQWFGGLQVVAGIGLLLLGGKTSHGSPVAAIAACFLCLILVLLLAGWAVYTAANGFFSLLAWLAPLFALLGAAGAGIAIPAAQRMSAVRSNLFRVN